MYRGGRVDCMDALREKRIIAVNDINQWASLPPTPCQAAISSKPRRTKGQGQGDTLCRLGWRRQRWIIGKGSHIHYWFSSQAWGWYCNRMYPRPAVLLSTFWLLGLLCDAVQRSSPAPTWSAGAQIVCPSFWAPVIPRPLCKILYRWAAYMDAGVLWLTTALV
jgi:hypothetical protein